MQENNKVLKKKVRHSYMISTVSIALVLFLLGTVGYLILNAVTATERMKESVTIYVMLKNGLTQEQQTKIKNDLIAEEVVKETVFVSKDEAAKDFKEYVGTDFVEFLKHNPLPDSYEVRLNARSSEKDVVAKLEKKVITWQGVDEVVYQRNVIEQISSNINKFNMILLLFGGPLLVISLILLNNTIRVTIFAKRYLINTMKLVGATQWFIIKPFMSRSIMQGVYAAIIAIVMFAAMIAGINEGLPEVKFSAQNIQIAIIAGAMLVGGVLISLIFTTFAVRKFVRMQSNKINEY